MDWNNIDLKSGYERDQNMLGSYNFETLLLEIHCNLPEINRETVKKQFKTSLQSNIDTAREIFEANLNNIVKEAREYRNKE